MLTRSHRAFTVALVVAASLPAGAAAADVRSPDARGEGGHPSVEARGLDLRSPDAMAGTETSAVTVAAMDLRSPDAVDGAAGSRRGIDVAPASVLVSSPVVADDGFQWSDAGIGAGILFVLLVLSAGGYALIAAHRRSTGGAPLAH